MPYLSDPSGVFARRNDKEISLQGAQFKGLASKVPIILPHAREGDCCAPRKTVGIKLRG
jgi:hypothetical protein